MNFRNQSTDIDTSKIKATETSSWILNIFLKLDTWVYERKFFSTDKIQSFFKNMYQLPKI